jgi:hypothetical protein
VRALIWITTRQAVRRIKKYNVMRWYFGVTVAWFKKCSSRLNCGKPNARGKSLDTPYLQVTSFQKSCQNEPLKAFVLSWFEQAP